MSGDGWEARVFLGSLLGHTSPVPTYTPLLGAELLLEPRTTLRLDVDAAFEHGVLVDDGVLVTSPVSRPSSTSSPTPRLGAARSSSRRTTSRCGCCCSAARRSARRS